jgi:hypothetical protein
MAGDWIKMRGNLWDDPRVAKLADLTNSNEAMVIGALYWLWATADQHTEDGKIPDLSERAIDRKTGLAGFASALISVGWLEINGDGVQIPGFEKHNGQSAKKRCQTARRVSKLVAANAINQPNNTNTNAPSVSKSVRPALAREEKRREEKEKTGGEREQAQTPEVGEHPAEAGPPPPAQFPPEYRDVIAKNRPDLARGAELVWNLFCEHYPAQKRTPARWEKWVNEEKKPGQGVPAFGLGHGHDPWHTPELDPDSKASVEALGIARGLGRWDGMKETFLAYKKRVRNPVLEGEKCL